MDTSKSTPDAATKPAAQHDAAQHDAAQHDAAQSEPSQSQPTRQVGEGSYEASRDYGDSMKAYLETADVKADAEAAKPVSPEEAEQLKKAEQEGLSHSKAPGQ
jgi:hypothetical protein